LPQGVLRRACFPGVAACACGSGFRLGSKSTFDPRTRCVDLDFSKYAGASVFHFRFFVVDGECRAALRAELRPTYLTFPIRRS
jgi:hypothetical protein